MLRIPTTVPAVLLSCAFPCRAQEPPARPTAAALSGACGVTAVDGVLHAAGPGYSVAFDRGGFAFTPALGARAPRSAPLRFSLESIRRGREVIHVASRGVPARDEGDAVTYARGPGITERYEIRADGMEQSFVFAEPPPGSGDLIVTGRIETDLGPRRSGAGLCFDSPWGGVRVGEVVAVDARGAREPGTMRLDGDRLELSLPASVVDSATYPLVLDPLIGSEFAINTATGTDARADVAYDATNDVFLVVWERQISATDSDVLAQRVRPDGTLRGALITITNNDEIASMPSVANVEGEDRFVVAWTQRDAASAFPEVRCRTVDAATGSISGRIILSDPGTNNMTVDVGGSVAKPVTTCSPQGCAAFVVWAVLGNGIKGQALTISGGSTPAKRGSMVDVTTDGVDRVPAISKNGGPAGEYFVVWQHNANVSRVRGAVVDETGQLLHPLERFGTDTLPRRNPDVDGDGTDFMVVYDRAETPGSTYENIYCRMVHWDGNDVTKPGPETLVYNAPSRYERFAAVSLLGPKYLVVWQGLLSGQVEKIYTKTFDTTGCIPCGGTWSITSSSDELWPAVASQRSGTLTPADDRALIAFNTDLGAGRGDVLGHLHEAVGGGGSVVDLGGGCGAGSISASGEFAMANASFRFELSGAPAGATAAWLNLNASVPPTTCGPVCAFVPPFVMIPAALAGAAASVPVPIPCNLSLIGGRLTAQWWVAGGPAAPCLPVPLTFSSRLLATVGY